MVSTLKTLMTILGTAEQMEHSPPTNVAHTNPGIKAISRLLNLLLVVSLAARGLSLAARDFLFPQKNQKFKMPFKPRKYKHFSTSPCLSNLVPRFFVDKPTRLSDLQSQTKTVGTLPPNAVFLFWPISSPSNVGYHSKLTKSCTPTLGGQEDSKVSQQF